MKKWPSALIRGRTKLEKIRYSFHIWQRVPNPPIFWRPPPHGHPYIAHPSFFNFFSTPFPSLTFFGWMCDRATSAQQKAKFTVGLTQMTWLLLALWFDITQTNTHTAHTGTDRLTHKYILRPSVMCSQQLPALHSITHSLISKTSFIGVNNCFSKITYLQKSHVWLDSIILNPSFEKQSTEHPSILSTSPFL